ncbi:hypothetical protein Aph01nite_27810 [Acrocarpospora phusangensis]|uniref:Glycosyl hydrolase family 95 N-terminal domain-containing protein n=1 Tax=Acrocarpospora phusangensis TaxID=1070424 RepID=A0A919QAJ0_9ACTN|nr:glycoside hydrolase N-terminal domain-containing protein [Acrocarpospora phusangensis]GIH24471.1 hypothetical protein Aph01nite_27810 [Acrocarpospora phusangensis]
MISGVNGFASAGLAEDWEHALITGNGRQGALVQGGPGRLLVTLSHERLFLPLTPPLDPPHTARILPELRSLLYGGAYQRAADRVLDLAVQENPAYTELRQIDPLVPSAVLTFHPLTSDSPYFRTCDFTSGVVAQGWPGLTQEVFASRPDDVIAIRLTGDVSGALTLSPPGTPPPAGRAQSARGASASAGSAGSARGASASVGSAGSARGASATVGSADPSGDKSPQAGPVPVEFTSSITGAFILRLDTNLYRVECHVTSQGGHLWTTGALLEIRGARSLTIIARTTFTDVPLPSGGFDELLARHAPVHGDLFHRSRLRLTPGQPTVTAEETLAQGGDALTETLYAAGRYAIISSVGDLPPTLQGVWSGTYQPAWQSGYTLDGNLQSAVAGLLGTGTPELLLPLFDLADSLLPDFRLNATRLYGCRGILTPVHLSTHGRQNHFTPRWCQTFWTAGAAWLARLYFDYYSHTRDTAFLRTRAIPFMTEAATFYDDFLDERGNFVPSYSPENAPPGETAQAAINATMDLAAVRDLLANLGRVDPRPRWDALARRLPDYRVAPTGELAEWAWDLKDNHQHRHASHLYPFWYEPDLRLAEAGAQAVRKRLEWWRSAESDEMAYGLVQIGLAAAGLGMTAEAAEALTLLSTRYWRPNLVSTHNRDAIFNVDICGGTPALIAAMLLRSTHEGRIDLLPACPWPSGEVTGLRARNGVTVERLAWSPRAVEVALTAVENTRVTLDGRGLRLPAGVPVSVRRPV